MNKMHLNCSSISWSCNFYEWWQPFPASVADRKKLVSMSTNRNLEERWMTSTVVSLRKIWTAFKAKVMTKNGWKSKDFGFVSFKGTEDEQRVVNEMTRKELHEKQLCLLNSKGNKRHNSGARLNIRSRAESPDNSISPFMNKTLMMVLVRNISRKYLR